MKLATEDGSIVLEQNCAGAWSLCTGQHRHWLTTDDAAAIRANMPRLHAVLPPDADVELAKRMVAPGYLHSAHAELRSISVRWGECNAAETIKVAREYLTAAFKRVRQEGDAAGYERGKAEGAKAERGSLVAKLRDKAARWEGEVGVSILNGLADSLAAESDKP